MNYYSKDLQKALEGNEELKVITFYYFSSYYNRKYIKSEHLMKNRYQEKLREQIQLLSHSTKSW